MEFKKEQYLNNAKHQDVLIRLEDWSKDYDIYKPYHMIVAYPLSKKDFRYIKENRTFRLAMSFEDEQEANEALNSLIDNKKDFSDYLEHINPSIHECVR